VIALLVLCIVLAVASIGLAAVEAAFYLLRRRRLSHVAQQNPRAEMVNRYLEDPPTLLMPVHIGTFTAHAGMTVIITAMFLDTLNHWAMLVAFSSMVIYLLLFRLTLPYALVRRNPERSLLVLIPFFHLYAQAMRPLVVALRRRAALQADEAEQTPPTPLPEVPTAPVHERDEARLVDSLERFTETAVRDVMTPRPDVVAIPQTAAIRDLWRLIRETKYSRVPVFGDNLDDIVGVVDVRDMIDFEGNPADPLKPLVRPVFLVPETKKIAELLKELQAQRTTFAVVIDEYGGTAGIVSIEDIVEELVGEIKDPYDTEAEPISVEADGAVVVAGRVNIDRLEQALETTLAESDEIGTAGGLVTTVFGRVPRAGEKVDYKGFALEVLDAERKRVNRVRFRRLPPPAEA
jgi:CBS domain containing-hemolysin-like protein